MSETILAIRFRDIDNSIKISCGFCFANIRAICLKMYGCRLLAQCKLGFREYPLARRLYLQVLQSQQFTKNGLLFCDFYYFFAFFQIITMSISKKEKFRSFICFFKHEILERLAQDNMPLNILRKYFRKKPQILQQLVHLQL